MNLFWKSVSVLLVAIIYIKLNGEDTFNSDVRGKNVLVTGASQGIGEQLAYKYAEMGANVFITARNEGKLKKVINECVKRGRRDGSFGYAVADMEMYDIAAAEVIKEAVNLLGGIDHLILNHAYMQFQRWKATEEDLRMFEKIIEVDLISYVHLVSHALPHLKQSSFGRIGVISSMAGKMDVPYSGPYAAAKFALDGFFSALRQEFRIDKENVSVTICPLGVIDTKAGGSLLKNLADFLNLDYHKFINALPHGDPGVAATEVIRATSQGQREMYYPPVLGTQLLPRLVPIVRHLWPELLDPDFSIFQKN